MGSNTSKRCAGVLIPVFALRRTGDFGIGDTTAVRDAITFCSNHGIRILQLLPINETGGDNSPYNAISSLALDPALLTLSSVMVPGLTRKTCEGFYTQHVGSDLRSGPVHYKRVKQLKLELLELAFDSFIKKINSSKTAPYRLFRKFKEAESSWLPQYTLFRVLLEENVGNPCWPHWRPEHRTLADATQWLTSSKRRVELEYRREFFAYVQWVAYHQWDKLKTFGTQKGVELMGDIPFGVSRYSADVWSHPELFDLEWSGGAPQETYFDGDPFIRQWGQNWGIPLYNWKAHEAENFAWWRQRVHKIAEIFHVFRIDHVLGFFRIYAFPWQPEDNSKFINLSHEDASKITGGPLPQFLPRPDEPRQNAAKNCRYGRHLLKMILDAAGETSVVAEDLGVVPEYVRPALRALKIPGFTIPIFERDENTREFRQRHSFPKLNLATYATHDHDPLRAFYEKLVERWHGANGHESWLEIQRLMRFLKRDDQNPPTEFTHELHESFLNALMRTPCRMAICMITDVLGTSQRFNEPGLSSDGNWSQRLDRPLADYMKDPIFAQKIEMFERLIHVTKRK